MSADDLVVFTPHGWATVALMALGRRKLITPEAQAEIYQVLTPLFEKATRLAAEHAIETFHHKEPPK